MTLTVSGALLGAGGILASLRILRPCSASTRLGLGKPGMCFGSAKAGEELDVTGVVGSSAPWTLTRTVLKRCSLLLVSHH